MVSQRERMRGVSIIIFMQLKAQNITLLRRGCNSELLLVQEEEMELVIKAVPVCSVKEMKHLQNEWAILSKLVHDNIVEAYRFGKDVALPEREGARPPRQPAGPHQAGTAFGQPAAVIVLGGRTGATAPAQDIKLDNILICDHEQEQGALTAKLADFGFATILRSDQPTLNSFKGTRRGYMAPEIHACKEDCTKYYDPKAADIFALGVVLFAVVLGRLPFEFALSSDKLFAHIAEGRMKEFWASHAAALSKLESDQNSLAAEFQDLFENLVNISPQKRLTIEEAVRHPWTIGLKKRAHI